MSGTDNYELPDRHAAQAEETHPAPCARHCEANAYEGELRRLKRENSKLRETAKVMSESYQRSYSFQKIKELAAERDELLGALKGLVRAGQKQGFADSYEREMIRANEAIAKHEGEKHE